jgi:NodT family efflux transporter outer membrane factor (OMF) lipoprotein
MRLKLAPAAQASSLLLPVLLVACAHAPSWHRPQADVPASFRAAVTPTVLPGKGPELPAESPQQLVEGAPSSDWWASFGNPALTGLVEEALSHHPDIDAAQAALAQAQADLEAGRGQYLAPQISAQGGVSRQRISGLTTGGGPGAEYKLFNTSVAVSYHPDLFGGIREALDGLGAQVDLQRYQLESARLALSANLVTTAFREAGIRAERAATLDLLRFLEAQRDLAAARLAQGAATRAELLSFESALRYSAAGVPALDKNLALLRNQLARYVGRAPGGPALPEFRLEDFVLPADVPLSLPSALARQRPDLRAAEEVMRAANAAVGVANANRLPGLALTASLGAQSTTLATLLKPDALLWSLGANVAGTVLDGGALAARQRSAQAYYAQVEAQYRSTMMRALQDVVDVLAALDHDARSVDAQRASLHSAQGAADLIGEELRLGAATRQQLLSAQIYALQAAVPLGPQRAERLADTAALYGALGGGWSQTISTPSQPTSGTAP